MGLLEQVTLSGTDSKDKNISKYFYNNAGVQIKMYTGMSSENDTSYLTSKTVNSKDSKKNVSKSYEYDNMGRITKTVSNEITTTTIYDSLGRKYTESEYNKNGYSIFRGYFYEGVSQYVREELTGLYHLLFYSDKTYEYDSEMRVVKVKEAGEETVSYTYDRNGNKKSETLANGVVSTYDYNSANRIVKLVNKKGNSTISSYKYSYYLDGSDACKVHSENGIIETTEYEYDGLKRLTEESVAKGNNTDTYSYEYDDYGNRSKMTATGSESYETVYDYSVNGKYTALLQKEVKTVEGEENSLDLNSNVKQTVYTYDANGNQITKTAEGKTETNTYDSLNQLIGFTDGETTVSYKYNASGLRYEKTVDGQTINHVWDGNKQIVADVIDNQFYEADCYIRGTNLVAKYNYWNGDKSEYTYYTQNAHGDVVNLTDKDGKVTKSYRYDAFGVEISPDSEDVNVFRFCGEYFDTETGTVYLRARYYQASIGRFISRDSFSGKKSDPLSLNLYTYCRNNPISYADPSGYSYATLPNGKRMSINSASDAKLFNELKSGKSQSSQVKTTTPIIQDSPITGGITTQQSTTTYTTIQTMEQFYASQKKKSNLFSELFGYEISTVFEQSQTVVDPIKCGIVTYSKTASLTNLISKQGDSSKPISIYLKTVINNPLMSKQTFGIKFNGYNNQCVSLNFNSGMSISFTAANNNGLLNVNEPVVTGTIGFSNEISPIYFENSITQNINNDLSWTTSDKMSLNDNALLVAAIVASVAYGVSMVPEDIGYNPSPAFQPKFGY